MMAIGFGTSDGFDLSAASGLVTLFIGIGIILIVSLCLALFNGRNRNIPPGPWGLPIVGSVLSLGTNPHLALTKMMDKYGSIFSIKIGSRLVVVLSGANTIREELVKRSAIFAGRPSLPSFHSISKGGHGLAFVSYSRKWAALRRACEKAVHGYISSGLVYGKIENESRRLVDYFRKEEGKPFDVLHGIHFATANVILCLLFDTQFDYDNEDLMEIVKNEPDFQEAMGIANAMDFFPWLQYFTPSSTKKKFNDITNNLLNLIEKLYRSSRRKYKPGTVNCLADSLTATAAVETEADEGDERELNKFSLTEKDLVHTLFDMFGAGFDTTGLTLHWAAAYLIANPDIQQKLHQEIDSVLPRYQPPSFKDRHQLPFLHATIYELLRITSLLPEAIPHSTTADVFIAGYTIPKDTVVCINLWSANHDPKAWKDPDVFNPGRFLDEEGRLLDPKTMPHFLPFSAGRRKCLGERMAVMELFSFLGTLLQHFQFTQEGLNPEQQGVDLTPKFGFGLSLKPFLMRLVQREHCQPGLN